MTITPSQLKSNRILFTYIEEKGTSSEHWPWPMPSSSSSSWWRSWWRSWCPRPGGGRWLLRMAPNSRCLPLGRRVSRHRHHNSHPFSSLPFFGNEQLASILYMVLLENDRKISTLMNDDVLFQLFSFGTSVPAEQFKIYSCPWLDSLPWNRLDQVLRQPDCNFSILFGYWKSIVTYQFIVNSKHWPTIHAYIVLVNLV